MSMDYYGMDGQKITLSQFSELFADDNKRRVEMTTLPGGVWISTVLLGLDHGFGSSIRPIIFETMVFPPDDMGELDMDRYSTKEEAQEGHQRMVTKWTGWTPGDEPPSDDVMVVMHPKEDDVSKRLDEHRERYGGASYVLSDDVNEGPSATEQAEFKYRQRGAVD